MATYTWKSKDPDEVLDYRHDMNPRLGGTDTIIGTPDVIVEEGDVVVDDVFVAAGFITVWLSGGTDGTKCKVVLRVVTTGGRTYEEGISLRIKAK